MSTNTIDAVRNQNMNSLHYQKDIGLSELDGFQLPSDVTEEFLDRMQEEITILGMVDTMTMERLEQEVPQFGVPLLSGSTRDEEGSRTDNSEAESGYVKFDATDKKYYILVEPKRDALKNTHYGPDQFGDYIVDEFVARWANDVGLIGIRAGASTGDLESYAGSDASDLDDTFTGWIALAEGEDSDSDRIGLEDTDSADVDEMPSIDMSDEPVDTEMFNDTIQQLDPRYRNTDRVAFLMSPDQVQQYGFDLTQREDPLGSAVIFGDSDITPFSYDVIGVNGWPNEYAMLTDPNNLAYGLFEGMELDQTTDTDKVHEERLHSRNWMEGQFDFQIKELQAGVLVENIADPAA
ncbi:MAG: hypothetical protein ACOCY1_01325 [Halovenus sp.]